MEDVDRLRGRGGGGEGHLVGKVGQVKAQEGWHSGGSGPLLLSFPSEPGVSMDSLQPLLKDSLSS